MTHFHLNLLGGFELLSASGAPLSLTAKKARAVLACLALSQERPQPRDKLAAMLWTDSGAEQARTSLRQALSAIRKALGEAGDAALVADADTVAAVGIGVDVVAFEALLRGADALALEQAVALYRGELLDGFHLGEPAFDDWIGAERERFRGLALDAMAKLLAHYEQAESTERAVECAARLVQLDPLQEAAHRALMRLYDKQGRHAAAIKQYRLCREALQRELRVSPEPRTDALYQTILRERRTAETESPAEKLIAAEPVQRLCKTPAGPELRQATVLLVDLAAHSVGEDDPEAAHALLSQYRDEVRRLAEAYGGSVINAIGARVLAVFGVPVAHGNDSERGVRAALAISSGVTLSTRIGVASGPVLATHDVNGFAITGEPIDIAIRVMEIAEPGAVLMTNRVFQTLSERLNAECLPDAMMKVDGKPGDLWRPRFFLEPGETRLSRPFVGRQQELRQLTALAETAVESGAGGAILIRGDAGIGKSGLVEAFGGVVRERGFTCHKALILDFGGGAASDPGRVLAQQLVGLERNDGGEVVKKAIADGLLDPDQIVFMNDLLGLPQPEALQMAFDAMDNAARNRGVRRLLSTLIERRSARRPLLIVVEDVHWADASTLDRLAGIAAAVKSLPVLLAMTTRTENDPINAAWRAAAQGCPLTTIDLGPLSETEAKALANHYGHADDAFAQSCVKRAEGNPLFLDQLLRAGEGKGSLPDSLQSIVLARLDRLDGVDRRAVQAASVLGQRFSLDVLRHLIGDAGYDCAPLVAQVIVRPEGDDYLFLHALIQEAVNASMLKSMRLNLHRRAAEWYAERDLALAAEHLDAAGDPAAALACFRAAESQAHLYRHDSALRFAERAMHLARDNGLCCDAACLAGQMLRDVGRTAEAVAMFREGLALAPDARRRGRALLGLASGLRVQDCYEESLAVLKEAERVACGPDELAEIHYMRGNIYFPMGDMDACLKAHELALYHARIAGAPIGEARALSGLGDAYFQRGKMLTADRYFSDCVTIARQHGLTRIEVANLPMVCSVALYRLSFDEALAHGVTALALSEKIGDYRTEIITRTALTLIRQQQWDWDAAKAEAERAVALARRIGARRFEAESSAHYATAVGRLGSPAEAERLLDDAWALSQVSGVRYSGPTVLGALACWTTNLEKRRWALAEGEALLAQGCVGHAYLDFYKEAIAASLAAADWDGAEHFTEGLAKYTQEELFPWAAFYIAFGRLSARFGRGERSEALRAEMLKLREQGVQARWTACLREIDVALKALA